MPERVAMQGLRLLTRVPFYVWLGGWVWRSRGMPGDLQRALARAAGMDRLPLTIAGELLPVFRKLGTIAVIGILVRLLVPPAGSGTSLRQLQVAGGLRWTDVRADLGTLLELGQWLWQRRALRRE
jgi:hypothetical protein